MTKRGISLALALAMVLALGVGTTAQASSRLTLREATKVAAKFVREQRRKYDLRANHVRRPRRVSGHTIAFAYDARTRPGTYCTATLRVHKTVSGRHIRYSGAIGRQACLTIPHDALAVERATRRAQRGIRVRATKRSVREVGRKLARCQDMRVPRSRRSAVAAVVDVAETDALVQPNVHALLRFEERLDNVQTHRRVLAGAIGAWIDYFGTVGALPAYHHPCGTLKRWRDSGWSASESPIDMRDYRAARRRATADKRAIARGARFLARVGILPRQVVGFTPAGLLLHLGA